MDPKHPQASKTIMTDTVLPSETNAIHTLFGGELLARMDRAASIAAQRHSANRGADSLELGARPESDSPAPRPGWETTPAGASVPAVGRLQIPKRVTARRRHGGAREPAKAQRFAR